MEELILADRRLKGVCDDHERDLRATIERLDCEKRTLVERLDALNKRKNDIAETYGDADAADDDLVEVNAGGTVVAARRGTLTRLGGTRMEALFSGRYDKKFRRDENGCLFLDINSACFQAIIDYLHEMAISSGEDPPEPPIVDDELQHVLKQQLDLFGILDRMHPLRAMLDSNIIKNEAHANVLHEWLREGGMDGDLRLLYRSSRDDVGTSVGANFHPKCDNQGCTIVIIETSDGFVFGGCSNADWRSAGGWNRSDKAFLFVLSGTDVERPYKMRLKNPDDDKAVYYSLPHGPIFGEGLDLFVNGKEVYLKSGVSYESGPPGQLTPNSDGPCNTFSIKELEVLKVLGAPGPAVPDEARKRRVAPSGPVDRFTEDINKAMNAKQESLLRAETEIIHLEESFNDEYDFINAFACEDEGDVVHLNVGGTAMVTTRSTLRAVEDSVLAQQFDDSKWTEQGTGRHNPRGVKEWTEDDVCKWVRSIEGIPDDAVERFEDHGITGRELLALGAEGLRAIGIERTGTIYLLKGEIKKLQRNVTLIEHSPYCFGKILDHLRLKWLRARGLLAEEPHPPVVRDAQRGRFEKVARYYFPGDGASFVLE